MMECSPQKINMPVFTSNSQGGETADQRDYYRDRIRHTDEDWRKRSFNSIIEFIDRLEADFPRTEIWLLTSHDRLVLMDAPEYDAGDWLVTVEKVLITEFHFRYKMPKPPIPNAGVQFIARGVDEAVTRLKIAMKESGGWSHSPDLDSETKPGERDADPNSAPALSSTRHDHSTISSEVGARPRSAVG
jgi:hypothetical protein